MERLFAFLILFSFQAYARVENLPSLIAQAQYEQSVTYKKIKQQLQPSNEVQKVSISYPEMKAKIKKDTMIAFKP